VERLPSGWDVRTPDLPGHGTACDLALDLAATADRLAASLGGGPALVIGYSMGGRTALRLALDHPEAVTGLVLVGATAGIDDLAERAARRAADEALADRIEAEGVEAFLDRWLTQPLFAGLAPEDDDLAARRANTATGLASSLRAAGTGTMDPPWWDELAAIAVPTLVVWGEADAKFAALGRRLAEAIGPNAETTALADVGHAAHLEAPDAFAALVRGWAHRTLGRNGPTG
jgi:2-succinyl-6-hydroxy-2,4-cyclohexadiene-1-carboxylate synthase